MADSDLRYKKFLSDCNTCLRAVMPTIYMTTVRTAVTYFQTTASNGDPKLRFHWLHGEFQSGKTMSMVLIGLIYATPYLKEKLNDYFGVVVPEIQSHNQVIITGFSNRNWKTEMKNAFPHERIFHNPDLKEGKKGFTYISELQKDQPVLIMLDECHIASKENSIICKLFRHLKALNREAPVFCIYVSATQFAWEFSESVCNTESSVFTTPDAYLSLGHRIKMGLMKEFKHKPSDKTIQIPDVVEWIKEIIDGATILDGYYLFKNTSPRITLSDIKSRLHKLYPNFNFVNITYKASSTKEDKEIPLDQLQELLLQKPTKPTLVYMCKALSAGTVIAAKHIVSAGDLTNPDTQESYGQSLTGRLCGYDPHKMNVNLYVRDLKLLTYYDLFWKQGVVNPEAFPLTSDGKLLPKKGNTVYGDKALPTKVNVDDDGTPSTKRAKRRVSNHQLITLSDAFINDLKAQLPPPSKLVLTAKKSNSEKDTLWKLFLKHYKIEERITGATAANFSVFGTDHSMVRFRNMKYGGKSKGTNMAPSTIKESINGCIGKVGSDKVELIISFNFEDEFTVPHKQSTLVVPSRMASFQLICHTNDDRELQVTPV